MKTLEVKKNIFWTGIQDPNLKVFDITMETKYGSTYNSYVIKGSKKTALFETAKEKFENEYFDKLTSVTAIEDIDYLVVNHTEPDHAGSARDLLLKNPSIKVVGSATAIKFMKDICNMDFNSVVVKNGDTLSLGDKTLTFINAQNLHWPDTMYTYVEEDKLLISCDSFGAHYCFGPMYSSKIVNHAEYRDALKFYFDNIIAPFKPFVLKAIDRIKDLDIDMICTGHGPILDDDPWKIINIYKEWATEINPNSIKTIVIPYVSAYGYTEILANKIEEGIKSAGNINVRKYDLVYDDPNIVINDMYFADGILVGTPTILGDALQPIWHLLTSIHPGTHGGKIASAFGSYGWSGEGVPNIMARLRQLRMKCYGKGFKSKFRPSEADLEGAFEFGYGFGLSVLEGKVIDLEEKKKTGKKRYWKCLVCGEIVEGDEPPEACPVCGVGPEQFEEIELDEITFSSTTKEKIVIVGGGIAALSAAEAARKRNSVCDIEIISDENVICYNRPMLTKGILSEFDAINFFTKQYDWYSENNITITLDTSIKKIDLDAKKVILESGEEKSYDKLVYATGAECNIPPIPGFKSKNVRVIRRLSDANDIREMLPNINDIVIVGGGVLGLEAAWEFAKTKKKVTVLDVSPKVMGRQLDSKGSELLKKAAIDLGLRVINSVKIDTIKDDCVVVSEGDGISETESIKADLVVISAGVKPNASLGIEAGLDGDRFINVNEAMLTSNENVYACGDVAAFNGTSIGIWDQAISMGAVAGANAVGDELVYSPIIPANSFSGFNMPLFSVGDIGSNPENHYKAIEVFEDAKHSYKKLYFLKGKFCGGILMGDIEASASLLAAYKKGSSYTDSSIKSIIE